QKNERAREKEVTKRRLATLLRESPEVRKAMDETLAELNGKPGQALTYDALDQLLQEQSYRLAWWRVAAEEINARRSFAVNDLAAIRMEEPEVWEAAHAFLFGLIDERRVHALRLDHTDGLYDPYGYFESVQRRFSPAASDGATWSSSPDDRARPL